MKKRCLVLTGGGDCPGLNAVIRAIVKRASVEKNWEILGSVDAFNGFLREPMEIVQLTPELVRGIHVKGGTIIGTTNKGGPFNWPVKKSNGTWGSIDISDELLKKIEIYNIDAIINIGGDGSQKISQKLYEKGCNIIGVPKTIDNDLSHTDYTFGFSTAVDTATDALDKLVTTASSHHRVLILEVMGRDTGWIALHSAIAAGAEICLIPEIPYNIEKIKEKIEERVNNGKGFLNLVIAEGAKSLEGKLIYEEAKEVGYENKKLGGVGMYLMYQLQEMDIDADIRVTVLGHLQRGGIPNSFDRILATEFGVKAFEMVLNEEYGKMVAVKNQKIVSISIKSAISQYNLINLDSDLIKTAKGIGIYFGE